jgi:putative oxidoreductase
MFSNLKGTFVLRLTVSIILIMHSIPGMFDDGINNFGQLYLNEIGFAPVGVFIAWLIKLSHVAAAICFMLERFIKIAGWITIAILVAGIFMVHLPEGWYVVGGGRNGIEFNVLLIAAVITIMFPTGFSKANN